MTMSSHRSRPTVVVLGLLSAALLAGCSGNDASAVKSLQVTPASLTLAAGLEGALTATATFGDGSTRDVTQEATWSSGDAAVATVSGGPGVKALKAGQATLKATFGGRSAEARLQVTDAAAVSLALTPAAPSLAAGLTQQLTATATFTDGSVHALSGDVTWSSSSEAVATVSATGLVRAIAPGTATLKAQRGAVQATTQLTVTAASVTALSVSPADASLARGSTRVLTATATFSDGSSADVSAQAAWSSSDGAVVALAHQVASGLALGSAQVTATFRGASARTQLTVAEATQLSVTPASTALVEGHRRQLRAEATLANGRTQDVSASAAWTSSRAEVALVSMDAATRGEVTAAGPGEATLGATFGSLSASAQVSVSRLSVAVSVPTFQAQEDGVLSFTAQLSRAIPASTRLRWRLTLSRRGLPPEADAPVVGQMLYAFAGAPGEVAERPDTWTSGSESDGAGVAYVGGPSGFALGTTGLQGDVGQATSVRTAFAIKGSYALLLELLDVTDAGAPLRLGEPTAVDVTVGTVRAEDASELLLYAASPDANETWPQAFSVHPDGTQLRQLTPTSPVSPRDVHSELTRSPDRKTVAWVDGRDMSGGIFFQGLIYVANADGSNVRRLTQADAAFCGERSIEYSPDGQWITFVRSCTRDPFPGRSGYEFQYLIRADGTDERRVLIHDVNDMPAPTPISAVTYGTFSRDSATLYTVEYLAKGSRLWAYRLADGSARLVLDLALPGQEMAGISKFPMVLPNGDLLYHYRNEDVESDTWLERIAADGTGREIIRPIGRSPTGKYLQSLFALSPDGTRVAYAQLDPLSDSLTITVSRLDGTEAVSMGNPPSSFVRRISWVR